MHGMIREEKSKLLKRHDHKQKKPYFIEYRMPDCGIPAFERWHRHSRYETKARRDQALHDLRKSVHYFGRLYSEYRAS